MAILDLLTMRSLGFKPDNKASVTTDPDDPNALVVGLRWTATWMGDDEPPLDELAAAVPGCEEGVTLARGHDGEESVSYRRKPKQTVTVQVGPGAQPIDKLPVRAARIDYAVVDASAKRTRAVVRVVFAGVSPAGVGEIVALMLAGADPVVVDGQLDLGLRAAG